MAVISEDFRTDHLSNEQCKIAQTILIAAFGASLTDPDLPPSGNGNQAFHRPEEWNGEYGKNSVLVVSYCGSDLYYYASLDGCYEMSCMMGGRGNCYASHERITKALEELGYYMEECTRSYAAIYKA
jgi:hypothetical protein